MSESTRPGPFDEPTPGTTPTPPGTPAIPPDAPPAGAIAPGPDTLDTPAAAGAADPSLVVGSAPAARTTAAPGRGIRMRTVVFGLVLLVISASVLIAALSAVRIDVTAVVLAVLIGAGAALVTGGLAAAIREARGGPGA